MVATTPVAAPEGVLAVVVTAGVTEFLPDTLAALASQDRPADSILVIDVGGEAHGVQTLVERSRLAEARVTSVAAANLAGAVGSGLAASSAACRWLWLLHDDSIPDDGALAALLGTVAQSTSIAVAGCKQRRLDDTAALIEVGLTTTRFGRRVVDVPPGTIDQGQCDDRDDVLAVGTAGMLVAADVWRLVGGLDPALGPFGDGLEFCRRVRLAGFRVVVVPSAIVFHGRAALMGLRGKRAGGVPNPARSEPARRRAWLYQQYIGCPLPLLPVVIVLSFVTAIGRMVWKITAKQPAVALAELLAPLAVLVRPGRIAAGRARLRRTARLPRRALRSLQTDGSRTRVLRRAQRLAASGRGEQELDDLELANRASAQRRRRLTLLVLVLALSALCAAVLGQLITAVGLHGGALLPLDADLGSLWQRATSSWQAAGLGSAGASDPLWFVLSAASLITLGNVQVAVNALLVLAPAISGLGAWFAAGAATRSLVVRLWVTVAWLAAPPLWFALAQGRLGAVVAHAVVPFGLLALARACGANRLDDFTLPTSITAAAPLRSRRSTQATRRDRRAVRHSADQYGAGSIAAAAAAALLYAVVTAGAPVLAGPLLLTVLVAVLAAKGHRTRVVIVALGPVIALAPLVQQVARGAAPWQVLIADPGLALTSDPAHSWLRLLGWPADPAGLGVAPLLAIAAGAVVGLAALAALGRRGGRGWAVRGAWVIVIIAAAGASWLSAQTTGIDQAASSTVAPWSGSLTSLAIAGLLAAAAIGSDGVLRAAADHPFGWRQVSSVIVAVAAIGVPLVVLGAEARYVQTDGVLRARQADPVPVIAIETGASSDATRTLLLAADGSTATWQVVRGQGPQLTDVTATGSVGFAKQVASEPTEQDAADQQISNAVAILALRGQGDAVRSLADAGIGYIVVPAPSGEERASTGRLSASLDSTNGLIAVNRAAEAGTWRVAPDAESEAERPARARITTSDGTSRAVVPSGPQRIDTRITASGTGLQLRLAERADAGWRATLNGKQLVAATAGWQQAFELPANPKGRLVVDYQQDPARYLLWVQGLAVVMLALLSIPISRRWRARSEEV